MTYCLTSTVNDKYYFKGEGALVLYLNNDSFHGNELKNLQGEKKICNLLIKTKKGLGLLVYAEEMDLRQEKNE